MDVSVVDINIEFKYVTKDDAFASHDSSDMLMRNIPSGRDSFGQITAYAAAQIGCQWRTCVYSIFIMKEYARLLRWDRSGLIVSAPIFYNKDPALAQFLWRYTHATPADCEMDPTVTHPTHDELEQATLQIGLIIRPVKITIEQGDITRTIITSSPTAAAYAPPGHATRGLVAYDVKTDDVVF